MLIPFGTEIVDGETRPRLIDYCPWRDIDEISGLIGLFQQYENGFMLESGGIMNQPVWYTEAMQAIASAKIAVQNRVTRERIRRQQEQR